MEEGTDTAVVVEEGAMGMVAEEEEDSAPLGMVLLREVGQAQATEPQVPATELPALGTELQASRATKEEEEVGRATKLPVLATKVEERED